MRIGMMVGEGSGSAPDLASLVSRGQMIEAAKLDTAWIANIGLDGMTAAAVLGQVTHNIEIGTAVVPTFTRHPVAMLAQATTTQQACAGRFTLGVGLAHKFFVEDMWGLSYQQPAKQMRAYLEILSPGLRGEAVAHSNEFFKVNLPAVTMPSNPQLLVAALGPMMLRIAGEHAAGTITWATGIKTIAEHIVPTISTAANSFGRAQPRVVAGLPVLLTNNIAAARDLAATIFSFYAQVPSYRAMLDREGVSGIEDLALIGDERLLAGKIAQLESAGVTDLCVFPFETCPGEIERTVQFLGSL